MLPDLGNLMEVELAKILRVVENLVAFGVALQQGVFDAVVNHLHVVSGAARTNVRVAVVGRQREEDWLAVLHRTLTAADHQAVAVLESPDTAARSAVDELDSLFCERFRAPHRVVKVRVAAIDDNVALR